MRSIGILGGTGKQGRGLGLRWAMAGHPVRIGSRDVGRAADAATELTQQLKEALSAPEASAAAPGEIDSGDYAACLDCDVVVVAVPFDGMDVAVEPLADRLDGRTIVSCISPVTVDEQGPRPVPVEDGSASERLQRLVPGGRVVGAFQNVAARKLLDAPAPLVGDILLTGDDTDARQVTADLVASVPDLRPIHAGPLRLSRPVEEITAVQMSINMGHKVVTSLRLEGFDS